MGRVLHRSDGGAKAWRDGARLSREALAALGAATGKNLLPASSQHTLAEAVAALAHEAARLISAFHGRLRQVGWPYRRDRQVGEKLLFIRGLNQNAGLLREAVEV
jgi:hypothetical protein